MRNQEICPVMGNPVEDPATAPSSKYDGKTYYFCCPPCKDSFDKEPDKYINGNKPGAPHGHHGHHCHH